MVPFRETIKTKEELIEECKKGFANYSNKKISKNDFCMFFGFTHGEAITKFYPGNYEQLLVDGGFNTGSSAYFSAGINAWKNLSNGIYDFPPIEEDRPIRSLEPKSPLQQIYYGAPGTGKSHKIKEQEKGFAKVFRTTFHPDSDYSTFVGCYKPTMEEGAVYGPQGPLKDGKGAEIKENKIVYSFVAQAFTKAYMEAWKKYGSEDENKEVLLVIEEINRGNCAQIFGDLFQLLDRNDYGFSDYPIDADHDLQKYIAENGELAVSEVYDCNGKDISEEINSGEKLMLPPNLYIWATMNTSDQSLFPIDSAFKRRWDWKYVKIKEGKDKDGNKLDWKIIVKDKGGDIVKIKGEDSLSWWLFIQKINTIIASMTSSADKQLGYFFCKADNDGVISAKTFVSKVIFYLWNDVFKDYGFEDASLFRYKVIEDEKEVEKDLTFPDFYDEDGENVNTERLVDFIQKVIDWQKQEENA